MWIRPAKLPLDVKTMDWKKQKSESGIRLVSEQLNLTNLLDRSVFSLSGGEKQKIACGSAAAVEPDVFVLDEPSSNLDAYSIADFSETVKNIESQGKTIIICGAPALLSL